MSLYVFCNYMRFSNLFMLYLREGILNIVTKVINANNKN